MRDWNESTQLLELLLNGENSGLEFKRDDVHPQRLAGEMVALLNQEGGHILLEAEDDATFSGLTREPKEAEEWMRQIARVHIQPAVIPYWETLQWAEGIVIGVVSISGIPSRVDALDAKVGELISMVGGLQTTVEHSTDSLNGRIESVHADVGNPIIVKRLW